MADRQAAPTSGQLAPRANSDDQQGIAVNEALLLPDHRNSVDGEQLGGEF
jgi:hypothetical protein